MDKYITRTKRPKLDCSNNQASSSIPNSTSSPTPEPESVPTSIPTNLEPQQEEEDKLANFEADPGKRLPIHSITKDPIERESLRRAYLLKGPCQPNLKVFPQSTFVGCSRRFNPKWYKEFASWLEYSVEKDAVFCLCCYLFYLEFGNSRGGHDSFAAHGFRGWNKKKRLELHVGDHNSIHNKCYQACQDLMNRKQHVDVALGNFSELAKKDYQTRLLASLDVVRHLLRTGQPFRGHDESERSGRQGQFLETLKLVAKRNEEIKKVVLHNAPKNHQMISPNIQKDLCEACASLTLKEIIKDIGDDYFSILIDEARDSSVKEQMAVVLRYVDKKGCIIERFVGVVHVTSTTSQSLKAAIDSLLARLGLSMKKCRGQGYDGASNMEGRRAGLKTLILDENPSAYYVHCFAHQLQLALVQVASASRKIEEFFFVLSKMATIIGGSCKRKDKLREEQFKLIRERLACGEAQTGKGLNQETTFRRPGDTRWGSHYGTIVSLINLFSPITTLLEGITKEPKNAEKRAEVSGILYVIDDFDFAFILHLMKSVLGMTFDLSQALQRKDQDLANAISLIHIAKERLQHIRDFGFDELIEEASEFCKKHDIDVPNMEDGYRPKGRSRRKAEPFSFSHYYTVELFNVVLDSQIHELNDRFDSVNTKLIGCLSCLHPRNSFAAFDKEKLLEFAKFYPSEFNDSGDLFFLASSLDTFVQHIRKERDFENLKGIGELAQKMVEKGKDITFPMVYLLVKLALILPVATATVERVFSAMKYIKDILRNRMGDAWLNDCMLSYIESDILDTIDDREIIVYFQQMKERKMILP